MDEHRGALSIVRDQRIVGVLLFLKLLAFDTREKRYFDCQKIGMFCHAQEGTHERIVADRLFERLLPIQTANQSP
jgi:hypothetical protein